MRRYKRVIGNTSESRNDTFKSLDCMGDLGRALCSRVAQLISRRRRCALRQLCPTMARNLPKVITPRQRASTSSGLGMEAQLKSPACRVCIRPESSNTDAHHARPYQHYCRTPSPRVSCRDQKPWGRTKSKNGKTGRSGRQLNEKGFACTIRGGRIKASGCFTNSPSGLVDEPVSRERNADSQE